MKEPLLFDADALQPLMSDEFVFGVGTSAYQIEGVARLEGRTIKDSGKALADLMATKAGLKTNREEQHIDVA